MNIPLVVLSGLASSTPCFDRDELRIAKVLITEYDRARPTAPLAPFDGQIVRQFCAIIPTEDWWIGVSSMVNGGFYINQLVVSSHLSKFGYLYGITAPAFDMELL